jgi:hypothetical protein
MKGQRILPILTLLMINHLGCGKCKERDMERKEYNPEAHRYFDVLQAGNSWAFINGTGLRDSVWIEEYGESEMLSFGPCIKYPERRFKLVSNEIPLLHQVIYTSTSFMTIFSIDGDFSVSFLGHESDPSPRVTLLDTLNVLGQLHCDVIRVQALEPTTTLRAVYFAKGMGAIRYITETDTFNLQTSYVQ